MSVAEAVAKRSRCERAQIGAVIVSRDQHIAATGYNGPAASWPEEGSCLNWCPRSRGETGLTSDYDACPAIHAEANALMYVDRSRVDGGTIYITGAVCMNCAKLISNSGLSRVVVMIGSKDDHRNPMEVLKYLRKCEIEVTVINTP
jgi:dCMP deaminase